MTKKTIRAIGEKLPKLMTNIPGPESKKFAMMSMKYEPQSITRFSTDMCPIFWKEAIGANVIDVDGNIYVDCTSGFGVSAIGHTSPFIVKVLQEQSKHLLHSMGDIFPNNLRVILSKRITEIIGRDKKLQVIFANSGSECVEIAIKAALLYSHKPGIIAFTGSFHGQTLGALNFTGHQDIKEPFKQYLFSNHIRFMPFPYPYREGDNNEQFPSISRCLEFIENEIKNSKNSKSEIGTVIFEPIQGCNGYIIPPDSFIKNLYEICKKYNVLMIADEVFTGFGRTGKWLAMDHIGVSADIVCIGKALGGGIPISACVASKEIFEAFQSSSFLPLHGSTFSGNPIACACALETIHQIESQNLLESSSKKGQIFLDKLLRLKQKYQLIGDVRGRGLLVAIEIVKDRNTKEPAPLETLNIINEALHKGLVLLLTRIPEANVIGLAPPLTITNEQIDFTIKTLDDCIRNQL